MPRSRSRSIESSTCARMSRGSTVCVSSRMRSASVDLPWSMWAMIEKLRMRRWSAMGVAFEDMPRGAVAGEVAVGGPELGEVVDVHEHDRDLGGTAGARERDQEGIAVLESGQRVGHRC